MYYKPKIRQNPPTALPLDSEHKRLRYAQVQNKQGNIDENRSSCNGSFCGSKRYSRHRWPYMYLDWNMGGILYKVVIAVTPLKHFPVPNGLNLYQIVIH